MIPSHIPICPSLQVGRIPPFHTVAVPPAAYLALDSAAGQVGVFWSLSSFALWSRCTSHSITRLAAGTSSSPLPKPLPGWAPPLTVHPSSFNPPDILPSYLDDNKHRPQPPRLSASPPVILSPYLATTLHPNNPRPCAGAGHRLLLAHVIHGQAVAGAAALPGPGPGPARGQRAVQLKVRGQ